MSSEEIKPTALQRLINEPKGKIIYSPGEPFLLQVFWEAPSMAAANQLLDALEQCAVATHRDTPCVPTYFFRISENDKELHGDAPTRVKDHRQLAAAIKKLNVGIPKNAVIADWVRRGFDPSFLDLDLESELPDQLKNQKPVALEFTEVYLDERAFMEHAGSPDYLKGYGLVMNPALLNRPATTLRFGTPNASITEKILEPILREQVMSLPSDYTVWQTPTSKSEYSYILSLDIISDSFPVLPDALKASLVWCICFPHPHRDNVKRIMAAFSEIPAISGLKKLAELNPLRGELHLDPSHDEAIVKKTRDALVSGNLKNVTINASRAVGYILHQKAKTLKPE